MSGAQRDLYSSAERYHIENAGGLFDSTEMQKQVRFIIGSYLLGGSVGNLTLHDVSKLGGVSLIYVS